RLRPPPLCTLPLHDALPIFQAAPAVEARHRIVFTLREVLRAEEAALLEHDHVPASLGQVRRERAAARARPDHDHVRALADFLPRSEEHTSELQSREKLVCRL